MTILNRGLKSMVRRKFKTILFFFLIIILASGVSGAFLAVNAINSTATHLRRSLPTVATVAIDDEALEALGYTAEDRRQGNITTYFGLLTHEMFDAIAHLPYVRTFDYSMLGRADSFELEKYTPESLMGSTVNNEGVELTSITLNGVSRPNFMQLEVGVWELVEGRLFTMTEMNPNPLHDRAPLLISNHFAQLNGLSVGSIVPLYTEVFELPEEAVVPVGGFAGLEMPDIWEHPYNQWTFRGFEFEVVGVLNMPYEPADDSEEFFIQFHVLNQFIIPPWRIEEMNDVAFKTHMEWATIFNQQPNDDELELWITRMNPTEPNWVLYDLQDFEAFRLAATDFLPPLYTIEDMSFRLNHVSSSMEHVNVMMNQGLIFAIGATLIVLTLVILLYLRDRKHELGIYLALGEKKSKIVLQILLETLSVATIGMVIALFIGNILASQLSESLLRDAFAQVGENACRASECWVPISNLAFRGFGFGEISIDELIDVFDVSLNLQTIALFYGVGLLVVLLSTIVPVIYVLELKPKEILMQGKVG